MAIQLAERIVNSIGWNANCAIWSGENVGRRATSSGGNESVGGRTTAGNCDGASAGYDAKNARRNGWSVEFDG